MNVIYGLGRVYIRNKTNLDIFFGGFGVFLHNHWVIDMKFIARETIRLFHFT